MLKFHLMNFLRFSYLGICNFTMTYMFFATLLYLTSCKNKNKTY